uniref:Lipase domain-containing protein n=1 Tax=Cyprinus carpio TaxID=7962 RepID=A0A8C1XCM5_CYPCA
GFLKSTFQYYILFLNGHHLYIDNFLEDLRDLSDVNKANVKFSLRNPSQPDDDVCYIVRGKPETLSSCNFKNLFCHSWVSGLFESWKDANVIVVDWLDTAQNYYALAAQNTKMVGQEIGLFIDWLEESANVPLEKLHLLGYSLGAHIAGFAGSHATNKVGRITGLDPAGPNFEGVHAHRRLSPDDAHFVDVLHTFTRGSLGLSIGIGIEQPVGHVDIYPNGGSFQPGCNLRGALEKIANYGILGKDPYLGNSHERSVQLFIDSLLNEGEASRAYICGSNDMFNCGMCLQCHKNRRHIVGYDASKVRKARSIKMFTKTRGSLPFRVFHYQQEKITANKTYSFLVVTEKDIGDLLMLKFKLKESTSSLLSLLSSVRAGETQKKIVLCLKDPQMGSSAQDVVFVTCKEPWRSLSKR